jgi:hypothetical protein
LIWLNITCLDAPLVAIAWQWLFAQSFHLIVPSPNREALFLTAWLIYLIDRVADSVSLTSDVPKTARQKFCADHTAAWLGLIGITGLFDAVIVFWRLDHETFMRGIFLGAIAVCYLTINHRFSQLWETFPFKEIVIGFLFATGTLFAVGAPFAFTGSTIGLAVILFASLCALNCISIAVWERDLDCAQGKHSIATRWLRAGECARLLLVLLASACVMLAFLDPAIGPLAFCLGASAVFLFALYFLTINRDERVALADLVLLTPLVFLLARKIL